VWVCRYEDCCLLLVQGIAISIAILFSSGIGIGIAILFISIVNASTSTVTIMGTAIKHLLMPDRVKPSFVIFDIRAL